MSDENNEAVSPQNAEDENQTEAPRAKTPLELLREQQAKMRGEKPAPGRAANDRQGSNTANAYKRRQHQRRAG